MARTPLQWHGVGVVKRKDSGTFDNGDAWRAYEVAFDDIRCKFPLDPQEFAAAPEVDAEVEIHGRLERNCKNDLVWLRDSLVLAGSEGSASSPRRRTA